MKPVGVGGGSVRTMPQTNIGNQCFLLWRKHKMNGWWQGEGFPGHIISQTHAVWILGGTRRIHLTTWLIARRPAAMLRQERLSRMHMNLWPRVLDGRCSVWDVFPLLWHTTWNKQSKHCWWWGYSRLWMDGKLDLHQDLHVVLYIIFSY